MDEATFSRIMRSLEHGEDDVRNAATALNNNQLIADLNKAAALIRSVGSVVVSKWRNGFREDL